MQKLLYGILVISNPNRYARRYELFRQFLKYTSHFSDLRVIVVELAHGDRPFEVTDPANPLHVQVRTNEELWHKENMFNIGMQVLPSEAEYVAMLDTDISFARPDWVQETIQQLQHYPVVQMFSHCNMLGPKYTQHQPTSISFAFAHQRSLPSFDPNMPPVELRFGTYGGTPHKTGLAWAYRREVLEKMGGLMDLCIIGSADYHMAAAFINKTDWSIPPDAHGPYRQMIMDWQTNAYPLIRGRVGYVDGLVYHYWHGKMKDRRYKERWAIVKGFDPYRHLQRDWKNRGLLMLTESGRETPLHRYMMEYFRLRDENSIDE